MEKFICLHGHFYQPPRENPWLEEIEMQDSAYPYHDWNERISAECYAPNAAARILGPKDSVAEILNNYSRISFNFGPTLLSWLEKKQPEVYQSILKADRLSQERFSGHGSALAQIYNHLIMPLAIRQDQETQVIWGLRDFAHRFQRPAEGMWLPETAVDLATLEILAAHQVRFTILGAHQAKQVRKIGDKKWKDVSHSKIDPRMPYLCTLPSGQRIAVFFYDGPVANDLAFGTLLKNGEAFAQRLLGLFSETGGPEAQLVNVATDGETYGHHHRYGDMALAYCLNYLESRKLVHITIYGEYLEKFPPTQEVEIFEGTSWSCFHGVERWRSDCGCNSGLNPGFHQKWREPLRQALDELRGDLAYIYERTLAPILPDPWQARNDYIDVILDRREKRVEHFLAEHATRPLNPAEKVLALKLLEMERHSLLMFTSCGWFFDDISGIETLQVMQYAARAIQLAQETAGVDLGTAFLEHLHRAPSNLPKLQDGGGVWKKFIEPAVTDLYKVSAHYAVALLFENNHRPSDQIYCYSAGWELFDRVSQGEQKLLSGRLQVRSNITWESKTLIFTLLHIGDHNLVVGLGDDREQSAVREVRQALLEPFGRDDIPEVIRLMDHLFGSHNYSLRDLFKDEQRKILNLIMRTALSEAETYYRAIYQHHYAIIQLLDKMNLPLPKILSTTIEFILNTDITRLLEQEPVDKGQLRPLVEEMRRWNFKRDQRTLEFVASQAVTRQLARLTRQPQDLALMADTLEILEILRLLRLELNIWQAQNLYHGIEQEQQAAFEQLARAGEVHAKQWLELFGRLRKVLLLDGGGDSDA
jgi:alpha-amylase/alpha-mannosidase (GH57 family)